MRTHAPLISDITKIRISTNFFLLYCERDLAIYKKNILYFFSELEYLRLYLQQMQYINKYTSMGGQQALLTPKQNYFLDRLDCRNIFY